MPNNDANDIEDTQPMPMGEPNMEEPSGMGAGFEDEEPMQEPLNEPDNAEENGDSEIDDIFSKLDTEKKAAVIKYAKSMVDGDAESEGEEDNMVTEITNSILDDGEKDAKDGEDEKIRNKKITTSNPFVTKSFNTKK